MKKVISIAILVGMFGWIIYNQLSQNSFNQNSNETAFNIADKVSANSVIGLNTGDQAPDFELRTLSGETVKLSDYLGQRVMLNFWATWCPPCRAEMPDMEKFHQDKDVQILAVNLETSTQDIESFVKELNLSFPILLDKENIVASKYKIRPIPTSYMIDSNGIIQYKAFGPLNYEMMVQEFEKMK
ncbi:redoxin domain-containing protein [Aquibacillus halophilus]|uniref:Redoxin domain-containing protein n=1 Tax=Aquibacillus halophilus TaxID=930132 RepID=A0A6A8DD34_9BACI|nr:TlpA disulfide reductase family protein [Aquibacillus halophilus]MRH43484.1 redoxin domain-containing protein [Aquibacillus halophilus]